MLGGDESTQVTAGIGGFLVLFALALACWFLFRSMNAHLRNVRYAERQDGGWPREVPSEETRTQGARREDVHVTDDSPRQQQ